MKRLFGFLAALFLPLAASAVTLTPTQDSDVYSFTDMPTGTLFTLGVNASGAGAPHSQRTLIQFNATAATLGMTAGQIASAKLRLYVLAPDANYGTFTPGTVSVFTQNTAWTVPTLRWSTLQPGAAAGTLTLTAGSVDKWVEVDVTAAVVEWVAGTRANNGFLLQAQSETATPLLNATFASMDIPPGTYAPQLVVTAGAPFDIWTKNQNLTGANALPTADPDHDGVPNAVEFLTGGSSTTRDSGLLPTITVDATYLNFVFRRAKRAAASQWHVEYGSLSAPWQTAAHNSNGVLIVPESNGFGNDVDKITVRIPKARATDGKLFARLVVDNP